MQPKYAVGDLPRWFRNRTKATSGPGQRTRGAAIRFEADAATQRGTDEGTECLQNVQNCVAIFGRQTVDVRNNIGASVQSDTVSVCPIGDGGGSADRAGCPIGLLLSAVQQEVRPPADAGESRQRLSHESGLRILRRNMYSTSYGSRLSGCFEYSFLWYYAMFSPSLLTICETLLL